VEIGLTRLHSSPAAGRTFIVRYRFWISSPLAASSSLISLSRRLESIDGWRSAGNVVIVWKIFAVVEFIVVSMLNPGRFFIRASCDIE